jgi:hypothetical protein
MILSSMFHLSMSEAASTSNVTVVQRSVTSVTLFQGRWQEPVLFSTDHRPIRATGAHKPIHAGPSFIVEQQLDLVIISVIG